MPHLHERPICVRLSDETRRRYEIASAARGISLSQYLRERLENEDYIAEQISDLRLILLDDRAYQQEVDAESLRVETWSVLLELLLLTRQNAPPEQLRVVHNELSRLGMQAWAGNRHANLPE